MPSPIEFYRGAEIRIYESFTSGAPPGSTVVHYFSFVSALGILLTADTVEGLKAKIDAALGLPQK
jgi:hypothetical protein